jgi:hypothetical protein
VKQPWSSSHQDALDALTSLRVPKTEAKSLLEDLPESDAGSMLHAALRARTGAQKRLPAVTGGPSGAVPLHAPGPSGESKAAVSDPEVEEMSRRIAEHRNPNRMPPSPFGLGERSPAEIQALAQAVRSGSQVPPPAPMGPVQPQQTSPAVAQTQPGPMTAPVVPISRSPMAEPTEQQEIPQISTRVEYDKLHPGQVFRWHDNQLYTAHTKEPASSQQTEKPRIRVRTTGQHFPPAPLAK